MASGSKVRLSSTALPEPGDDHPAIETDDGARLDVGDQQPGRVGADVDARRPSRQRPLRFPPLRIPSGVALDQATQRSRQSSGSIARRSLLPDRVVVAGRMIGVVGVETLHPAWRAPDTSGWPGLGSHSSAIRASRSRSVSAHRRVESFPELGSAAIRSSAAFTPPRDSMRADTSLRQRAGQPVAGGEGRAVVEVGRHRDHHRQPEMASGDHIDRGPRRAPKLNGYDVPIIHQTRGHAR